MTSYYRLARASKAYRHRPAAQIPMTQEEIDVLAALCMHVGGSPDGPRGVIDRIKEKVDMLATERSKRDGRLYSVNHGIDLWYEKK